MRSRHCTTTVLSITLTLTLGVVVIASTPAGASRKVPAKGVMWGSTHVNQVEPLIGRKLALDHQYSPTWESEFPTAYDKASTKQGRTIIRNWKPVRNGRPVTWARIASGAEDRVIKQRADALRRWGKRMYLVFHHEADIRSGYGSPSDYARAYRRIVKIFRQRGARNVVNVFVLTSGGYRTGKASQYWPGDRYVDVVGVDGYDWRGCAGWATESRSFTELFKPALLFARRHNKPMFVVEYAADEIGSAPTHKRDWISRAASIARRWPRLRAMIWFNSRDQGCDWPVSSSSNALTAFRDVGSREYFRARAPQS